MDHTACSLPRNPSLFPYTWLCRGYRPGYPSCYGQSINQPRRSIPGRDADAEAESGGHWVLMQPGSDATESLHWRHNGHDSVSNHQPYCCLLNCLFRRRSKIISKLRVTGLCAGNSPETGEFPTQMASNAEILSVWWRHHGSYISWGLFNNFSRSKSQV